MASSPVILEAVQVTVNNADSLARYKHGMVDLYVFGYICFGIGGYYTEPQYVNFAKQIFFPPSKRVDSIKYQGKPGVDFNIKPIYGNFDVLDMIANNGTLNLLRGRLDGLRTFAPDGTPGPAPSWHALPPP